MEGASSSLLTGLRVTMIYDGHEVNNNKDAYVSFFTKVLFIHK